LGLTAVIGVAAGVIICAFAGSVSAQDEPAAQDEVAGALGIPQDWSHRHLIYPNPETFDEATANGTLDAWSEKVKDPRFLLNLLRKERSKMQPEAETEEISLAPTAPAGRTSAKVGINNKKKPLPPPPSSLERDWSMNMGGVTTTLSAGINNSVTTIPVTSGTGLANGDYITIDSETMLITAGGGTTSLTVVRAQLGTSNVAHSNGATVTSLATVGEGRFPAKYSFGIGSSDCTNDFVVFNTSRMGSATQGSLIAFNNLYTGCVTTPPSIFWNYNTGGLIMTSVVLSLDGAQVAFVHSASGGANLGLLKWSASASALSIVSNAAYRACSAPCMTTLAFNGSANDTNSSPFVDYTGDTLYVGDDNGRLHKFTGVFNGTPAEQIGSGFPATLTSTNVTTSPVFDPASGLVFVADAAAAGNAGFLYSVNASGTVVKTSELENLGFTDPPIVDSSNQKVYVFFRQTAAGAAGGGNHNAVGQLDTGFTSSPTVTVSVIGGSGNAAVRIFHGFFDNQFLTTGTGNVFVCYGGTRVLGRTPVTAGVLSSAAPTTLTIQSGVAECSPVTEILSVDAVTTLAGAITSTSQTAISVISGTAFPNGDFIQIDSEIMEITAGGGSSSLTVTRGQNGTAATTHTVGAVVSDIHDRIFIGTTANGLALGVSGGCTGACVYSFDVTSGSTPSAATASLAAPAGSSGIVIDNVVPSGTAAGRSQVYYSNLATTTCATSGGSGGCAIQASQKALQ
jgi:hypothetical protein